RQRPDNPRALLGARAIRQRTLDGSRKVPPDSRTGHGSLHLAHLTAVERERRDAHEQLGWRWLLHLHLTNRQSAPRAWIHDKRSHGTHGYPFLSSPVAADGTCSS